MNKHWNSVAQELRAVALESNSLGLNPSSANYLCESLDKLLNLSVPQLLYVSNEKSKNFLLHEANELIHVNT